MPKARRAIPFDVIDARGRIVGASDTASEAAKHAAKIGGVVVLPTDPEPMPALVRAVGRWQTQPQRRRNPPERAQVGTWTDPALVTPDDPRAVLRSSIDGVLVAGLTVADPLRLEAATRSILLHTDPELPRPPFVEVSK